MFLKRIEISGFKSFANKITLEFLDVCHTDKDKQCGITAIVGPNGSGKSNVADAIRWAMGEQSMKNLRGKKSEDVIFAGSGKKARLGSASVTLVFDNSDKKIPLEFAEVIVTRKLFRSGDSEYLINGSRVRLIDIADLLAKAGVGRESYSVITQGMSDAVLNATPTERRTILEDAAGVKQYQVKKERSLKKLDSTKENLQRVGELMAEIEPHLKMLRRQAGKALKGKDVLDLLRSKQLVLFSHLWHNFQIEKAQFLGEKDNLGFKMMNVQREVDILNDEVAKEAKVTEDFQIQSKLEKEREELYQKINAAERELAISETKLEISKQRKIAERIVKSIPVDLKYVQANLERVRTSQEELIKRIENAETLEELQDIKEFARAIQQDLHDLHMRVGQKEIKEEVENPQYKIEKEKKDREIQMYEGKCTQARKETEEHKKRIAEIIKQIQEEIEKGKKARQRFFELERELRKKQDELNILKDQFNEAKIKLARIEVHEEDLTNEVKNELKMEAGDLQELKEPINREELEREIARLKVQREQIGGIDPMVVDEYEETRKRFEFLGQESKDLEEAMASLKEVIKEMDQKIDQVFDKAFDEINKEFTKYFRIIFNGGNCSLKKTKVETRKSKISAIGGSTSGGENESPENSDIETEEEKEDKSLPGIEIMACPPGKKISSLAMLSGGERSLTSLALLFAIISYNPPPFAVLDEVEAALDEANSRRFSRILQELSGNTQFISITHNRETMRQASLLYGVTMGEDGISKVLSVKLDQVKEGGRIATT